MSIISVNMGLVEWTADGDNFSKDQLATNFSIIDAHNHTLGSGVQIPTAGIQTGAITSSLIANGAVTTPAIAANAVGTTEIQDASVTSSKLAPGAAGGAISPGTITANLLDPNVLPLGSVLLWWRPSGSIVVPGGGWEIMDGRPWSTITNSLGLSTGNIPDMRGQFPRGADINGVVDPGIGATGGSNTVSLAHSHGVLPHAHPVPSHGHSITTDGNHQHFFDGDDDLVMRNNAFVEGITVKDTSNTNRTNTFHTLYVPGNTVPPFTELDMPMSANGSHNHGGSTGGSTPFNTGSAASNTDSQLGSTSLLPSYLSLLFIMRCR